MARDLEAHECTLTITNTHGVVATCACGWYGVVWHSYRMSTPAGKPGRRIYDQAEQGAHAEHAEHVKRDGPLTYSLPPEQFVGVVINTKRFGHP